MPAQLSANHALEGIAHVLRHHAHGLWVGFGVDGVELVVVHQQQTAQGAEGVVAMLDVAQAGVVGQQVRYAKVILSGELSRKVSLKGLTATAGARAAIEAAGGSLA